MKVKNLRDYPQELADGRVIGAAGTKHDEREYDLPELAKEDKLRVRRNWLQIVEEEEKPADIKLQETKPPTTTSGSNSKGGTK